MGITKVQWYQNLIRQYLSYKNRPLNLKIYLPTEIITKSALATLLSKYTEPYRGLGRYWLSQLAVSILNYLNQNTKTYALVSVINLLSKNPYSHTEVR